MKVRWLLILVISFLFYHNNTLNGPDGDVYLPVAHSIVTKGHLNILPEYLSVDSPTPITKTHHAPIHQNIGGVLFIIPATVLTVLSHICAMSIPNLPQRFYDISYHEGLWLGFVMYILGLLSCVMTYRVARRYHDAPAVTGALLTVVFGGPLFLYAVIYPCNTNLPAAFLVSLFLYIYHFADLKKSATWMLLGAVLGLGVFVRYEFVVWGLFLVFAIYYEKHRDSSLPWRTLLWRCCLAVCGGGLFIGPSLLIRRILFGHFGSTYSAQMDWANLSKSYLMLWGTRNGLFVFWPVLLIALFGYFIRLRKNPPVHHAMFITLVFVTMICGTIIFWNGELGHSLGQRWFLAVFPCFVLFLSRLLASSKKYFICGLSASVFCVVWALLLWAAYGLKWSFPNDVTGFLMPLHFPRIIHLLSTYYSLFIPEMVKAVFVPKHPDVLLMLPLFLLFVQIVHFLGRFIPPDKKVESCLAVFILIALATMLFLAGTGERGERAFQEITAKNPQALFVVRNFEINFEILTSMVDRMAFFMELGDSRNAKSIKERSVKFLKKEAPDQLNNFEQACAALELRQSMGWYRLFPELIHFNLLEWYQGALDGIKNNKRPMDIREYYLF